MTKEIELVDALANVAKWVHENPYHYLHAYFKRVLAAVKPDHFDAIVDLLREINLVDELAYWKVEIHPYSTAVLCRKGGTSEWEEIPGSTAAELETLRLELQKLQENKRPTVEEAKQLIGSKIAAAATLVEKKAWEVLEQELAKNAMPTVPGMWLADRADGVQGHYCIGRYNTELKAPYCEFWNEQGGGVWCSAGTVYNNKECAEAKMKLLAAWEDL